MRFPSGAEWRPSSMLCLRDARVARVGRDWTERFGRVPMLGGCCLFASPRDFFWSFTNPKGKPAPNSWSAHLVLCFWHPLCTRSSKRNYLSQGPGYRDVHSLGGFPLELFGILFQKLRDPDCARCPFRAAARRFSPSRLWGVESTPQKSGYCGSPANRRCWNKSL